MVVISLHTRSWKHYRWKKIKFYSSLQHDVVSTNKSITQSAKVGKLDVARALFDQMPTRTVVSWNTMIYGYSKWGRYNEALSLVSDMHYGNTKLNETTFSTVLSVCAHAPSLRAGKQFHCLVLKSGSESFELVGSALLHLYSSCFKIEEARRVFDVLHGGNGLLWCLMLVGYVQCNLMSEASDVFMRMPSRDVIAWTTLISGYSRSEDSCKRALELFGLMRKEGDVKPNEFTLDCVLRACGRLGVLQEGRCVHGLLISYGFEFDCSIGDALVDLYCNCEAIDDAKRVYGRLEYPSLNASNSLIGGLIFVGNIDEAELIFDKLTETNPASYNLMIKGYAVSGRVEESKRLFQEMPHRTIASSNTMISVYSRDGDIDSAVMLFEETKREGNTVTWNSMISGFIQNYQPEEALQLYASMRRFAIDPSRSTFSTLFRACSCLGSLQQGQILHTHLIKTPFELNVYVGTSLIDMYSKCGSIFDAQASFVGIYSPNVVAWTALINAYAHHGLGSEAVVLFNCMLEQGVYPNAATFVGVLSACGHSVLLNEGMRLFRSMKICHGVTPTLEHYACVVGLLGRSGYLREAEELIKEMPIEADGIVWGALLSSCWHWMNVEVGERVAEIIIDLDPESLSAYIMLSNIYAGLGKWGAKMTLRKRMRNLEVKKDPGCSWIELSNRVHVFSVEDRTHPHCNLIYEILEHLTATVNTIVQFGYVSIPN